MQAETPKAVLDIRPWVTLGIFALVFYIFTLLALNQSLAQNEVFKLLAVAVISGSFCGGMVAFYYNTTQGSAAKDAVTADAVSKLPSAPSNG